MRTIILNTRKLLLLSIILVNIDISAQVSVSATLGTTSGTYSTLKSAFDKINDGSHKGVIVITLTGNTTETASAQINANGYGSASYSALTIRPTGAERTVSGSITGPIINIYGADNILIDGRVDGAGSQKQLSITNTSSSGSTLRLTNDACSNIIQYCIINGCGNGLSYPVTALDGSSTGSDNNQFLNCIINGTTNTTAYLVYTGNSGNDNLTISGCELRNFSEYAIYRSMANSGWIIQNCHLYNVLTPTSRQNSRGVIYFGSGSGDEISGNYIGGNSTNASGTFSCMISYYFYCIYLETSTAGTITIQNNTIKNFNLPLGSPSASMYGIYIGPNNQCAVDIGSTTGNNISYLTNTSGEATSNYHKFYGIYSKGSTGAIQIKNNTVEYITNNISYYNQNVIGIYCEMANSTYPIYTISNNIVRELRTGSYFTSSLHDCGLNGISIKTSPTAPLLIENNTIYNLINTGSSSNTYSVYGLYYDSPTSGTNVIRRNNVYGLKITTPNSSSEIVGIYQASGATSTYNNMVSLGSDVSSDCILRAAQMNTSTVSNYYFNTFNITGSVPSGSAMTMGFHRANSTSIDLRNNVLINTRTGGTGKHYGIISYSTSSLTSNYNCIYSSTSGSIGSYDNGTTARTFSAWQAGTSQDGNSISKILTFTSSTDLHLSGGSIGDLSLKGTAISGITTDYDSETRDVTFPYMGADENTTAPLPVVLVSFTGTTGKNNVTLHWQTATEVNNYGFNIELKIDDGEWIGIGFITGHGNSNSPKEYSYIDENPPAGKLQYRLKQIDFDGGYEYSKSVEVFITAPEQFRLFQNHPNPFNPTTKIRFDVPVSTNIKLIVYDLLGREIAELANGYKQAGSYEVEFNSGNLGSGVYFYQLRIENISVTKKMCVMK